MPGIKMRCRYRRVPATAWQLPSLYKGWRRTECVGRVVGYERHTFALNMKTTESFFSKLSVVLLFVNRVRLIHNDRLQFFHQSVAVVRMHGHFDFI